MHNLDTCEVAVLGDELNAEQESLEVDLVLIQQKGMEMSSSNLGMIITGGSWHWLDIALVPALQDAEDSPFRVPLAKNCTLKSFNIYLR